MRSFPVPGRLLLLSLGLFGAVPLTARQVLIVAVAGAAWVASVIIMSWPG